MMTKFFFSLLLASLSSPSLAAGDTDICSFEPDSFAAIKVAHAGKPFVVMIWSLDCAYCAESFAALQNAQRKQGIEIVTIATDRADSKEANNLIRQKIDAAALKGQTWAFGTAPPEKLRFAIDPKWRGEMPRTYWFNAKGEAAAYSGVVTVPVTEKFLQTFGLKQSAYSLMRM